MNLTRSRDIFSYAQLAFPLAFAGLPLYISAPDYYATSFGVSLAFLGGVLMAIRVADAFFDPLIGVMCDRFAKYRRIFMSVAALIFALSFAAVYNPWGGSAEAWFALSVFLATLSFSFLYINLNAIGNLIAQDPRSKTTVAAWREVCGIVGLTAAVVLPPVIGDMRVFALATAGIALVSAAIFVVWLPPSLGQQAEKPALPSIRFLIRAPFGRFFACYTLSMFASSLPAALVIFFIRDALQMEKWTGLFLLSYFAAAGLSIPLWRRLAAVLGEVRVLVLSLSLAAASISMAALAGAGDAVLYGVVCLVSGAAFGAELFLAPAILSAGITRAGADAHSASFFGIYAFCMKIALALATALGLFLLDMAGFKPGAENAAATLSVLVLLYALIPAGLKLIAAYLFLTSGDLHEKQNHHHFYGGSHAAERL